MANETNIEWADSTFNPWIGCTKVSPACDHCYAENLMDKRMHTVQWGSGQPRKRTSVKNWQEPLRWEREHADFFAKNGRRRRVFCASLADVFDKEVPEQWRADLFHLIQQTQNLDWLLLTKRIGNVEKMVMDALQEIFLMSNKEPPTWPLQNVWIGATICNQLEANRDIPKLLRMPATVRFLSIEPLLESIDLRHALCIDKRSENSDWESGGGKTKINWVIVGGESGAKARPMHPDWVRSLRDQCKAAGVPFLFKQWGEWCPRGPEALGYPIVDGVPILMMTDEGHHGQNLSASGGNHVWMNRAGKKSAGRLLDCFTHTEFPKVVA